MYPSLEAILIAPLPSLPTIVIPEIPLNAIRVPSGDQEGNSPTAVVSRRAFDPSESITQIDVLRSPPPLFVWKAIDFPSGDQAGCTSVEGYGLSLGTGSRLMCDVSRSTTHRARTSSLDNAWFDENAILRPSGD